MALRATGANAGDMHEARMVDVVVIGAGLCGLACAAALERRAVETLVIERGEAPAMAWRQRYRALRLISGRPFAAIPGMRFPAGTPMFPSREHMIAYLQAYADRLRTPPRTGTHVVRIDRADDGRWRISSPQGDVVARHVVVATGMLAVPSIPGWAGQGSAFGGRLLHSGEYTDAAPFRGARVVVIGGGTSALDIADDLVRSGAATVTVSMRRTPNILLVDAGGLPGDPAILLLKRMRPAVADRITRAMRKRTLPDLAHRGLPIPELGPFTRLASDGSAPSVVDRDVIDSLANGTIRVVGAASDLVTDGVELADGTVEPADAVLLATGFRPDLEQMVGHLSVLDQHGRPHAFAGEESLPGLRFVGFDAGPGLIPAVRKQSRRVARQIAAAVA